MNAIQNARRIIRNQYGLLNLPSIESPSFMTLIRGTRQLVNVTLETQDSRNQAKSMSVTLDAGAMASTDEQLNIKIPAWYCHTESLEKFVGRNLTKEEAAAISLMIVNGSSIHEALHVAHSIYLWENPTKAKLDSMANTSLMYHMMNITEDLKNESKVEGIKELFAFIDGKNEVFFSPERLNDVLDKATEQYKSDTKSIALEILVFYKNKSRRAQINSLLKDWGFDNVVAWLGDAATPYADALQFAMNLYNFFNETTASKKKVRIEESDAKAAQQKAEKADKEGKLEIDMAIVGTTGRIPQLIERDILRNRGSYMNYTVAAKGTNDFRFLKELKIARQIVPTFAEPKVRGTQLVNTRLSRIATDGKIFTTRGPSVASLQKALPEFIILGDMSGSMRPIIGRIMETIRKMSEAMIEANISHAVFGHTSEGMEDAPIVHHIFSYRIGGKTDSDHHNRFERAAFVELRQNYDGYAITNMTTKFSRGATKVLLVLSDGQPCGPRYDEAIEHTREAVEQARKQGIRVISLSLTDNVIESNDAIYGDRNNVDATTPQKLEVGLKRLILGS